MNIRILKIVRGVKYAYGVGAVYNVICLLRGETHKFVGCDGDAVLEYCHQNGLEIEVAP